MLFLMALNLYATSRKNKATRKKNEHFPLSFLSRNLSRDIICVFYAS